jgi:hypothetical protein
MCSYPTQDMDVCVLLFCAYVVLCVGNDQLLADPPSKESYWLCKKVAKAQQRAGEP